MIKILLLSNNPLLNLEIICWTGTEIVDFFFVAFFLF